MCIKFYVQFSAHTAYTNYTTSDSFTFSYLNTSSLKLLRKNDFDNLYLEIHTWFNVNMYKIATKECDFKLSNSYLLEFTFFFQDYC